jgi:hypothetical protein
MRGLWLFFLSGCMHAVVSEHTCRVPEGALRLSEVHANAQGADAQAEWIELSDVGGGGYVVDGVVLHVETSTQKNTYVIADAHAVQPLETLVWMGGVLGFTLPNTEATMRVMCGDTLLDSVVYQGSKEGVSWARDGAQWCEQGPSQGSANASCAASDAVCVGVEGVLETAPEGGLVVSEILADPEGKDAGSEWIEVYVASEKPFYMRGLSFKQTLSSGSYRTWDWKADVCEVAYPGSFVWLPVGVSASGKAFLQGPELYNAASVLQVYTREVLVDEARVGDAVSGLAWMLDAQVPYASSMNDVENGFCVSPVFKYTPAEANTSCEEMCEGEQGMRRLNPLRKGDVRVVQIMADPHNPSADNNRDYIVLEILSEGVWDLKNVWIQNTNTQGSHRVWQVEGEGCVSTQGDRWVVLAGRGVEAGVMKVHGRFHGVSTTLLYNEEATVVVGVKEISLDTVTYPKPVPGASYTWVAAEQKWCVSVPSAGSHDVQCL